MSSFIFNIFLSLFIIFWVQNHKKGALHKSASDLRCVQKNIVLKSGVAGNLDVDRSTYVGEPKHSPRLHRKVMTFEPDTTV